jgi:hypothetical protein
MKLGWERLCLSERGARLRLYGCTHWVVVAVWRRGRGLSSSVSPRRDDTGACQPQSRCIRRVAGVSTGRSCSGEAAAQVGLCERVVRGA